MYATFSVGAGEIIVQLLAPQYVYMGHLNYVIKIGTLGINLRDKFMQNASYGSFLRFYHHSLVIRIFFWGGGGGGGGEISLPLSV